MKIERVKEITIEKRGKEKEKGKVTWVVLFQSFENLRDGFEEKRNPNAVKKET